MTTAAWVALLRGIAPMHENQKNVQLRGVLEDLGFADVTSVLSSGNLVFAADSDDREALQRRLEAAWPDRLGFRSTSILRHCDEIAGLVEQQPFGDRQHGKRSYLLVTFAKHEVPTGDDLPQPPDGVAFELLGSTGRELFTVTDTTGAAGSPETMQWLEREFGADITSRTWRTVQRLAARCAGGTS